MAANHESQPDPRYGYPILLTYSSEKYNAYYLGERSMPPDPKGYMFVSGDKRLIDKVAVQNEPYAREVMGTLPNLDVMEFLDAPPIGKSPTKIEFKNRHVFVNGENIGYQIAKVCEGLIYSGVEVNLLQTDKGEMFITVICNLDSSSSLANVLATNELKRLGIWDITTLRMEFNPRDIWRH